MIWNDTLSGVIIQGITGTSGRAHAKLMLGTGTPLVAGITPGRGGDVVAGVPVYDTVAQAKRHHTFEASVLFAPGSQTLEAATEAIWAEVSIIVMLAEGVPTWDAIEVRALARAAGAVVVGPNTAGIIRPGFWKLGIMPHALYAPGRLGVISRSGSAMHEIAYTLGAAGIGQSTCADIGGDRVSGSDIIDMYTGFAVDPKTDAIVLIGEIGSDKEERLAEHLAEAGLPKPTAALIVGRHAPIGRRMGHAGAIIHGSRGGAAAKAAMLSAAGVHICNEPEDLVAWARSLS